MDRHVVVHGHFYQPPRENPWLELVEQQDSAWPAHDWNERITAECYRPNLAARVLDDEGRITALVDNYSTMSFNVGPTLLAWMADHAPEVHAAIVASDAASMERFGGHGSAMAQVHNHAIMPLCNDRDRHTQVRWGITDFRHRFGRDPEGMWLAETAADTPTLEALAEHGIAFTVLSPHQAAETRTIGAKGWTDVTGGRVDPTVPYRVELPSGRSIAVFFYDGQVSQAVAFEGLLHSGDRFAQRLLGAFPDRDGPALVNIATDGESYGHHHRQGEMALAQALQRVAATDGVRLTNYAEYLALHPPQHEARIIEGSSWSCAHGVERWRADCGCTNGETGGSQAWRGTAPRRPRLAA
jgi:alpha-amylase/alpha-mannosidase (GH57 family)